MKQRLDLLLVERGLAESRSLAQRLIMAGEVRVDGQLVIKPATAIAQEAQIEIIQRPRFVSRGGEKLEGAFQAFHLDVTGLVCADVGASTGGFTDCLLQHGAEKVYAIDVGQGILDWKQRQDPHVVVMENTNARSIERLPEPVNFVTIDVSFISLKILLPVVKNWFSHEKTLRVSETLRVSSRVSVNTVITLIKPQFEAGRQVVGKGKGVVRDPAVHRQVLEDVLSFAMSQGYTISGLARSPLLGPKGNTEFLAYLRLGEAEEEDIERLIGAVLEK